MLYNQHNLNVAKFAAKGGGRPELNGVYFTADKTVATDAIRLLEISTPANLPVADFPQVGGVSAMRGAKPFILLGSMLRERVKLSNKKNSMPYERVMAIKHVHENRVEVLTTDGLRSFNTNIARLSGKFPDYEAIFPAGAAKAEVVINGKLLAEMLEELAELDSLGNVKIKFYAKDKPVVLEAGDLNQNGRGMIMPIKE